MDQDSIVIVLVMAIRTEFMGIKISEKRKIIGCYCVDGHFLIQRVYNNCDLMIRLALEFN